MQLKIIWANLELTVIWLIQVLFLQMLIVDRRISVPKIFMYKNKTISYNTKFDVKLVTYDEYKFEIVFNGIRVGIFR